MEHKAFLFDESSYAREFAPILKKALEINDINSIRHFVNSHISLIKDPYEGNLLDSDWETLVEIKDAEQYGDFALTKYYDPTQDIGLGHFWSDISDILGSGLSHLALGEVIRSGNKIFDPGKMGSYVQSKENVIRNSILLKEEIVKNSDLEAPLSRLKNMLKRAVESGLGLYCTF